MWVVVQGVGAADKLWNAALGYLNRGGVIIQQPAVNPVAALTGTSPAVALLTGAMDMLSGQVCMLTIQKTLEKKLSELNLTGGTGLNSPCEAMGANENFKTFCKSGTVPSFNDTIDAVVVQDKVVKANAAAAAAANGTPLASIQPAQTTVTLLMPNFSSDEPLYSQFNGICGSIQWSLMTPGESSTLQNSSGLSSGESNTAVQARAIAVQQMFSDLLLVAQVVVGNDPMFASNNMQTAPAPSFIGPVKTPNLMHNLTAVTAKAKQATPPYTDWASVPYGEPLETTGSACTNSSDASCTSWGLLNGGSALLNGTELQSAILDYNGVMQPTLTLLAQALNAGAADVGKSFIAGAESQGWIMAGTYFFNLVQLNNANLNSQTGSAGVDYGSGLDGSQFNLSTVRNSFDPSGRGCSHGGVLGSFPIFCEVVRGDSSVLGPIFSLFTGQSFIVDISSSGVPSADPSVPPIAALKTPPIDAIDKTPASSLFHYLQNATVIQLPGSPPPQELAFANMMHVHFAHTSFQMPPASFSCMGIHIIVEICIGRWIGEIIYNVVINTVISFFTSLLETLVYGFLMTALSIPLQAFAAIFKVGIQMLSQPGINPIIALAQMGTYYINFVGKLWLVMLIGQVINSVLSVIGIVMLPVMAMAMPVVLAWSIVMLGIGMTTAYYVPLIPYMIFTFGAIAWLMAVIEAMVAAPIVALGVIHPEGHDAFGKGEAAIMILMNVFLRPAMMIIGYIAGISLSYVGVWLLNASFDHAVSFMQPSGAAAANNVTGIGAAQGAEAFGKLAGAGAVVVASPGLAVGGAVVGGMVNAWEANHHNPVPGTGAITGGYSQWAGVFAYFFSILIYTMMYMTIVEKAFTLISVLPDKVLRWIGGQPESHGQDAAQWMQESKGKVEKAGEKSGDAMAQAGKGIMGGVKPPESGGADVLEGDAPAPSGAPPVPPVPVE